MAVKIRLRRMGAKKAPFYRIVVADSRYPRDGRFIEEIGYYDPTKEPSVVNVDAEKAKKWIADGAQPTDTVKVILKNNGVHLSIDDFGSGYSSLGVFEQIPASVIKLDRSFLLNNENRGRQVKIMRNIVNLAHDLDAQVVCEGVETDADVELMRKHVGKEVKVKAAGGIASLEDAERFIALGADRLGTSRIVKIIKQTDDGAGY